MHDTEEVDNVLILEDLEKLRYLALRVCILTALGLLDLLIQRRQHLNNHIVQCNIYFALLVHAECFYAY